MSDLPDTIMNRLRVRLAFVAGYADGAKSVQLENTAVAIRDLVAELEARLMDALNTIDTLAANGGGE